MYFFLGNISRFFFQIFFFFFFRFPLGPPQIINGRPLTFLLLVDPAREEEGYDSAGDNRVSHCNTSILTLFIK